jgi:hypothetical protein
MITASAMQVNAIQEGTLEDKNDEVFMSLSPHSAAAEVEVYLLGGSAAKSAATVKLTSP